MDMWLSMRQISTDHQFSHVRTNQVNISLKIKVTNMLNLNIPLHNQAMAQVQAGL